MRLLLFSDLHGDHQAARRLAGEALAACPAAVIAAGDLADDGLHSPLVYAPFQRLDLPVLAVPGNHDGAAYHETIRGAGWEDLHGRVITLDGWVLAGHGLQVHDDRYSGPDPAAQAEDPGLTTLLARLEGLDPRRLVLVTHLPPSGTLAARDRHFVDRGNAQLRRWVEAHQPAAVLCGHVHLGEVSEERVGETVVVSAGPYGRLVVL